MRTEALKIDREALLAQVLRGAFPDERGRYGPFGGRYVPETLVPALDRLEAGVRSTLADRQFRAELESELRTWVGRPTPLTFARELSRRWGAEVWLKREDLAHTGVAVVTCVESAVPSVESVDAEDARGNDFIVFVPASRPTRKLKGTDTGETMPGAHR